MKVLIEAGEGYYEEKKSRFIASICYAKTEEEAYAFIEKKKKQYWDARHNCSAFVVGERGEITRCSDDGEPSQTAGKPMLEVLTHNEMKNVVVVVTRYFGGTLLGTGGLVKAYQSAVSDCLLNSKTGEEIKGMQATLKADYTLIGKIQFYFQENSITVTDTVYEEAVRITFRSAKEDFERILNDLVNLTSGRIEIESKQESNFIQPD
ncbi:MAG: YigZ family protein [Lachnospiraceae bacterium]|nr:YigZ family protein [Lachnospiraceae bacterium]